MSPGYWRDETGGQLALAVQKYLDAIEPLTLGDIELLRTYITQWIEAPAWRGQRIVNLRELARHIRSESDINAWLSLAEREGIDPL
jgi:hypothetical protein